MAIVTNDLTFIGAMPGFTVYKMKGSDKIIVRRKGGASKEKIKHSPTFERTRENNTEFGGCANASKVIRNVLTPIKHLSDYNFSSTLNKLTKKIQLLDTMGERGKRSVLLARYGYLLEGFQLNKKNPFDSIIRHAAACSIDRETGRAIVDLPELVPGINFMDPWPNTIFRFIVTMGLVRDVVFKDNSYRSSEQLPLPETVCTEWASLKQTFAAQRISLQLKELSALSDTKVIMVGIGMEVGQLISNLLMEQVKYAGSAKILAVR
jgi:hypothetical protein